ncbi:hypothetical protein D3C81_1967590 [compost metagenome]
MGKHQKQPSLGRLIHQHQLVGRLQVMEARRQRAQIRRNGLGRPVIGQQKSPDVAGVGQGRVRCLRMQRPVVLRFVLQHHLDQPMLDQHGDQVTAQQHAQACQQRLQNERDSDLVRQAVRHCVRPPEPP